jgi:hypothetical protein
MANVAPFFVTGANCKLKINGVTLAYATDLSYNVSIPHARARSLGSYETNSFEPLSYDVSGSFTVVRYVDDLKSRLENLGLGIPNNVSNLGNGVGGWTTLRDNRAGGILLSGLGNGVDGRADRSLNPASFQDGVTFDIEIYQKMPNGDSLGVARMRNARITSMNSSISKRSNMTQTFQFIAQFLDEDSFLADASSIST